MCACKMCPSPFEIADTVYPPSLSHEISHA
jgi:hypothetical protein